MAEKTPKGLHDGPEQEAKVEEYPERPYLDALTPEHKKVLEEAHQLPPKQ